MLIVTIALARPQIEFAELAAAIATVEPNSDSLPAYSEAASHLVVMMSVIGQRAAADQFLQKLVQVSRARGAVDDIVDMWIAYATSYNFVHLGCDPWQTLVHSRKGLLVAESISYRRSMGNLKCELGFSELLIGDFARGEENLRSGTKLLQALNETTAYAYLLTFLVLHLAEHCNENRLAEILHLSNYLIEQKGSAVANEGSAYCALASVYLYQGKLAEAEAAARRSIVLLQHMPPTQMLGFGALIQVLRQQGRGAVAQEVAADGLEVLQRMGGGGFAEVKMLLAAAEAFHAAGDFARAHRQLEQTLQQIQVRADKIPDPEYRAKYLHNVLENVHARSLAREWLGAEPLT